MLNKTEEFKKNNDMIKATGVPPTTVWFELKQKLAISKTY